MVIAIGKKYNIQKTFVNEYSTRPNKICKTSKNTFKNKIIFLNSNLIAFINFMISCMDVIKTNWLRPLWWL